MANVPYTRGAKRTMAASDVDTPSKFPLLSPPFLLKIPADANTSLPVWEAIRSQQVDVSWSINPYSISIHLTPHLIPAASKKTKSTIPMKRESSASVAHSSALTSTISQLITQQHGTSHTLPVLPPPSGQPQTGTFIISSMPLTYPQPAHQPSTPTKSVLSPVQTPTITPTKLQPPCKMAVPSPFHTKTASNIDICDDFLLRMCNAGRKCKMHHTPYPYHWQMWCVTTHKWVDLSLRSQVLLERIYCDVSREFICIKDGNVLYCLNFDSMELDDSSVYDGVRRLTNSHSLAKSPHFPSKWKFYWWNNLSWEEYDENLSTLLLKMMKDKEPECTFEISAQEYKLDFCTMTQTNITTGFQRKVRCRPVYRSPDSMQPYLQTGVHTDSCEVASDPPGANFNVDPLEEFSSWYPPVWCLPSEENYNLIDVPAGTQTYQSVQNLFYQSLLETRLDIISIQQVQNLLHWDKYQRHKAYMQKLHTMSGEPLERHLFHGTTKEASEGICHNNFDPRLAGVNGTSYGYGSYFATTASFSNTYSGKVGPQEDHYMFLAKVLVGKVSLGRSNYRRPPPLRSKSKQYHLYDTCVDDMENPTMFVVFDSCQCYPYYLIKYKGLPTEIDI